MTQVCDRTRACVVHFQNFFFGHVYWAKVVEIFVWISWCNSPIVDDFILVEEKVSHFKVHKLESSTI